MRALVTGAGGFVGCALARRLLARGDEVHIVIRPESGSWRLGDLGDAVTHRGDLVDLDWTLRLLREVRPDAVFHCAAHGAYSFERDITRIGATNVVGMANLLRATAEAECPVLVNSGTSSEYGDCDHAPHEDEPVRPNSFYAVTKAAATAMCGLSAQELGLPVTTLRLYSVYGPYEDPRRLMPALCTHALRRTWPPLADPWVVRDFVHIDDAIEAYLLAAGRSGGESRVFNVGSGAETSLRDLVTLAAAVFAIDEEPQWSAYPNRSWDVRCWRSDPSAIRRELGWEPRVGLVEGLRTFADWIAEHPSVYGVPTGGRSGPPR